MTYAVMMEDLEKRKKNEQFEQMNYILKEIVKII